MKSCGKSKIIFLLACTSLSFINYSSGVVAASDPDTLKVQWSYSIGCEDLGGPAVGPDGMIYVGGHSGYIHAVNPDGTEKWKRSFPVSLPKEKTIKGIPVSIYDAIPKGFDLETMPPMVWRPMEDEPKHDDFFRMIPTISDDGTTLYLSGRRSGKVYALSAADGSIIWEFDVRALKEVQEDAKHYGGGFEASPVIGKDGTIFCASGDTWGDQWIEARELGVDVGKITRRRFSDRRLYALNPDGTLKWIFTVEATDKYRTSLVASPAIGADGTIYFGSFNGIFYAIKDDGNTATELWRYENKSGPYPWAPSIYQEWWSSPAIGSDGTIYVGNNDSYLHAFNPDGTHKWKFKTKGEIPGSPVIGPDGAVYFPGEDNRIYAVNPDGSEKWVRTDVVRRNSREHPGSPVITNDGTLILGFGFSNRIVGLDAATGRTRWERKLTDKILELGTKAPPAIAPDGTIYAYADSKYHAMKGSSPLARSSWPTMGGNNSKSGRISDY